MRFLCGFFVFVLTINICIVAIFTGENIITRFPDIYSYEFTKSQITKELDLNYDDKLLAEVFSNYLFGKSEEFQVVAEYQGREVEVFTNAEQIAISKIKTGLNINLAIAVIGLLVSIAIIVFMIKRGWKEYVRQAYNYSLIFFSSTWLVIWICYFTGLIDKLLNHLFFGGVIDPDTVLVALLGGSFLRDWLSFNLVASCIFMIISRIIIWKFTEERRMFVA